MENTTLHYVLTGDMILTVREHLGIDDEGAPKFGTTLKRARARSVEHAEAWLRASYAQVSPIPGDHAHVTRGAVLACGGVR